MPTGYTDAISKGISFEQFAWSCARAFGALVTMRDDPSDAPIPERFEPTNYHVRARAEAEAKQGALLRMCAPDIDAAALADYEQQQRDYERQTEERAELARKYRAMLAEVQRWTPPTPEHAGLKSFMDKQIRDSIPFDCSMEYVPIPALKSAHDWYQEQLSKVRRDIEYHKERHAEEVERTDTRNAWIADLRRSLNGGAKL